VELWSRVRALTEWQARPTLKAEWQDDVPCTMKTYNFRVVVELEDAEGNPAWHAYYPALVSIGAATSGRTRDEALKNIIEVVRMIVQEFIEEGTPLPEGPSDYVEVIEISKEEHRITVTV
jgi:predicted RNase H-like HicB family nuclease